MGAVAALVAVRHVAELTVQPAAEARLLKTLLWHQHVDLTAPSGAVEARAAVRLAVELIVRPAAVQPAVN